MTKLINRVCAQGRQDSGHRRPRDVGEGGATRRCRSGSTTTSRPTSASPCSRSASTVRPLLAGDTVSYWLGPDGQNYEVNVQLPQDRRQLASDLGNLYLTTGKTRTRRRGADGAAAPGRRNRRDDEPADHQAPGAAAARRALRQRRRAAVRRRQRRRGRRSSRRSPLPPGYRFDVGGQAKDQAGVVPGGDGRARPRGDLHLPDPRVAVRELHAADRDHGVAAAVADRRVPRAAADRHDAQPVLDDRLHHADGPRDQERDPARRLRQPRAARRRERCTTRCCRPGRCGCGRS